MRTVAGIRPRSILSLLAVLLGAAVSIGAGSQPGLAGSDVADGGVRLGPVPAELQVPPGNRLLVALPASGVQIYQCTGGAWTFVEPAAQLGRLGRPLAIHFRGPSWESIRDGSLVEGRAIGSVPVAGSIPMLLLQATRVRGDGLFGRVSYLQRLATTGGAVPAAPCTDGQTRGVAYTARYAFYVPA